MVQSTCGGSCEYACTGYRCGVLGVLHEGQSEPNIEGKKSDIPTKWKKSSKKKKKKI